MAKVVKGLAFYEPNFCLMSQISFSLWFCDSKKVSKKQVSLNPWPSHPILAVTWWGWGGGYKMYKSIIFINLISISKSWNQKCVWGLCSANKLLRLWHFVSVLIIIFGSAWEEVNLRPCHLRLTSGSGALTPTLGVLSMLPNSVTLPFAMNDEICAYC